MFSRMHEPPSQDWRNFSWNGGAFDTARRPQTASVEGTIRVPDHLLLVTLRGGASNVEVNTDCGHRYSGPDRPGAVSFVPAYCERHVVLSDVRSEWASISLNPRQLVGNDDIRLECPAFSNVDDPFITGLVTELSRLFATDGRLDKTYCEAMSHALACYLARRYGKQRSKTLDKELKLPAWRLRRIADYVEAHIDRDILVSDLANLVGVSSGHLHRAFRQTMGITPLDYITDKRIRRAMAIMAQGDTSIAELALQVGFVSPSHFTRTFRRVTGMNPSAFRAGMHR
jgi:AraC family transcriptional regulator